MTLRSVATLTPLLVVAAGLLLAADDTQPDKQDPPVLLKKKPKADAREAKGPISPDKKPEEPATKDKKAREKPEEPESPQPKIDEEEVLNRVSKNMRLSEDHLSKKDLTEGTRQIQRDIVKDLDSLIELQKQPPSESSSDRSSAGGSSSKSRQRQLASRLSSSRRTRPSAGQPSGTPQSAQGNKPGQANKGNQGSGNGQPGQNSGSGASGNPAGDKNNLADVYKDIWGHLPESLRAEMDAYSREAFMAKYKDLIERYYATIAEKSRRQGE